MATLEDFLSNNFNQKGGFATEQTLGEVRDALTKTKRVEQDQVSKFNKSTKEGAKDIRVFGTTIAKMNPVLSAVESGFNVLGKAITGASGLVRSIASADGSFESLGGVVDFAAETIQNTFGRLPIIGGFISASAAATAEITKLRLTFMDLQKETFQNLAATGLRLNTNLGEVIETVLGANISIDQFNRLTLQNADGLRVFGGTMGNAAQEFTARLNRLTNEDSEIGMGLRMLGLGSNEIAEEFADFIQTNRNNAFLLGLEETELNKQLQQRVKSERIIAELTGKSVQEQRRGQIQLATDAAFQAALLAVPPEQRAVFTTFVEGLEGPAKDAAKQLLAFGTITDEQTALLSAAAPGLIDAIQTEINILKGGAKDADASIARILKVGASSFDSLAELTKLGIIDPKFSGALGDFFNQVIRSSAQVERLQQLNEELGTNFKDQADLVAYANKQYEAEMEIAKKLAAMDKDGLFTQQELIDAAAESGIKIDGETARIIQQAAEVEDAVGEFQRQIFATLTDNFTGLADVTVALVDAFGGLLEKAGVDRKAIAANQGGFEGTGQFGQVTKQGKKDLYTKDGQLYYYNAVANEMKPFSGQVLNNFTGGGVFPGQLSMVGEMGPELLAMGNSMGQVINNRTTNDIMSASAGVVEAMKTTAPEPTGPTAAPTTTEVQRVINNMSEDLLKQMVEALNQSNMIQSTMLKETKRSKRFDY